MNIKKIVLVTNVAMALCLVSACGKKEKEQELSPEAKEQLRSIKANIYSAAKSLTVINPRHDEQYYVDMLTQAATDCVSQQDPKSCVGEKFEQLKRY